uniref:RHS repeat protein n=1 Tax=Pleionea sediminis TaxID=2569479 RepID=UPI0011870FB6
MAVIISSEGLGLFNSTADRLGNSPMSGNKLGQANGMAYINTATGNLVVQQKDEILVGKGVDAKIARTYNSLGHMNDADGWRFSFERELIIGSSLTRITGDEHRSVFESTGTNTYQSTDGSGAHDTITFDGTNYTYTEGSTGLTETYKQVGGRWLLDSTTDASGQGFSLRYDAQNRVSRLMTDNGENTWFKYDASNRLTSVELYLDTNQDGTPTKFGTATHYVYDNYNRLTHVRTDLTPGDNSIADGEYYEVEYQYQGTGLLIESIKQSDGTEAHFTYDASNRIKTYRIGSGNDGEQQSFTFDYSQMAQRKVSIIDARNQAWTYQHDTEGRLEKMFSPASNGIRQMAEYQYDADGNLTKSIDGENRTTVYDYDARGNLIEQIDSAGNRVVRTYTDSNRLASETQFLSTFDAANIGNYAQPDLSLNSTNTNELTAHYLYDGQDRLRYVVSADKKVTEYRYQHGNEVRKVSNEITYSARYDGAAQVTRSNIDQWRDGLSDKSVHAYSLYWYDFRGELWRKADYANTDSEGRPVENEAMTDTRFTYDAFGNLVSERQFSGTNRTLINTTTFVYDGMQRLVSSTNAKDKTSTLQYVGNQVITTSKQGLMTTQTYNSQGVLVSQSKGVTEGSSINREQQYFYDLQGRLAATQDSLGGVSYQLYNTRGQLEYSIDETGAVVYFEYDNSGRLSSSRQYAKRIDTSELYAKLNHTHFQATAVLTLGSQLVATPGEDRVTQTFYDEAGRVKRTIDGEGNNTYHSYDGASRRIKTEYRDGNSSANARVTRSFYNEDGQLIGQLDAEGSVSKNVYNGRGLLTSVIRYATPSDENLREAGTLEQLIREDSANDQVSHFRYDGQGRQIMAINAEGYVTETRYLESGNKVKTIQYAKQYTGLANAQKSTIIGAVNNSDKRETIQTFNELGQLATETNYQGTVTEYYYNNAGQVTQVNVAEGETDKFGNSESRTQRTRYNLFGEKTGQVADSSSAFISTSALDNLISAQGVSHQYDELGRLVETVDAEGNRQLYFYDSAGQLAYSVNGDGEVTQQIYNAFGELETTRSYADTINVSGLAGGKVTNILEQRVSSIANAVRDVVSTSYYNQAGQLATKIQGNGRTTTYQYNGWGELSEQLITAANDSTIATKTTFTYNNRGEQTSSTNALGQTVTTEYDAFGRVTHITDALGNTTSYDYDRLGREILITDPLNGQVHTTYDAFNRTYKTTDKLGNVTEYRYDDASKTNTIIFADGSTSKSIQNRHGETIESVDGLGNKTQFTFNDKGELTRTTDALGNVSEAVYDKAGRVTTRIDKNGIKTEFTYDQAGRVLTQIHDADGLKRTTRYQYDGLGNQLTVTDPNGNATRYVYNNMGQIRFVIDAEGYVSENVYDANGNVLETKRYENKIDTSSITTESEMYLELHALWSENFNDGS